MTKRQVLYLLLFYDYLFTTLREKKAHGLRGKIKTIRYLLIKDNIKV